MDYAVGAGIFLIAVAFAVGFGGQLFVPFGGEADSPAADRLADQLTGRTLGDPGAPGGIDPACTADFFEAFAAAGASGDACTFAEGTPADALGATVRVNVSVEYRAPRGVMASCADDAADPRSVRVVRLDTTGAVPRVDRCGDLKLSTPTRPPAGASVTTARRVALLDGRGVRLVVRVW